MYPIGYVREGLPEDATHGSRVEGIARLELLPTMAPFLEGLADEKRLTVIWAFDRSPGVTTVFNRRDGKQAGIFSSHSPNRINPIAITHVDLVRVEGTTLYVRGLDAYEGSPVLDIKNAPSD
jgi:tRNA (Thr-GGU) A37 N-methylase